jgi:hypothetical protein
MNELVSECGVFPEFRKALSRITASQKVQEVCLPHTFSLLSILQIKSKTVNSKHDGPHAFPTLYPFALPQ